MPTREWVQSEYAAFEEALGRCTVDNFKTDPAVRRMLSCDLDVDYRDALAELDFKQWAAIRTLDGIGMGQEQSDHITSAGARFVHWALQILKRQPTSIIEIGGGCGQLYATLRTLGWKGSYRTIDQPRVIEFQERYVTRAAELLGWGVYWLDIDIAKSMLVSFYALGEFTDEIRQHYVDTVIRHCSSGLIVWNPGDYATKEPPFSWPYEMAPEVPLTGEGNQVISW